MAKLTSKARNSLKSSSFALPGRKYPIPDKNHARAALSRVSEFGDSEQKAKVRAKVRAKYPGMGKSRK